jgi:two-component system response regulator YesN
MSLKFMERKKAIAFIIISVAIIYSTFFALSFIWEGMNKRQVTEDAKNNMSIVDSEVKKTHTKVKEIITRILNDNIILNLFLNYEQLQAEQKYEIQLRIYDYLQTYSELQSIYIYSSTANKIFINNQIFNEDNCPEKGLLEFINTISPTGVTGPIPRIIKYNFTNYDTDNISVFTYVYKFNETNDPSKSSAVVINVKQSWVQELINDEALNNNGIIEIIDNKNRLVSNNKSDFLTSISPSINKNSKVIDYSSDQAEPFWKMKYIINDNTYFNKVCLPFIITFIFATIICLLYIFIITRIIKNNKLHIERLKVQKIEHIESQNNYYISNLLSQKLDYSKRDEINSKLEFLDISINFFKATYFIYIEITNRKSLDEATDISIIKNIIMYKLECFDIDIFEKGYLIIINASENSAKKIEYCSENIKEELSKYHSTECICLLFDIPFTEGNYVDFYNIYNGLKQKAFIDYSNVIKASELEKINDPYIYPDSEVEKAIEYFILGKLSDGLTSYQQLSDKAAMHSPTALRLFYLRIVSDITMEIYLNSQLSEFSSTSATNIMDCINQSESKNEADTLMTNMLIHISEISRVSKNVKQIKRLEQIKKYIEENYENPNLSIHDIAELMDMTVVYVGKIFKEQCKKSISEYINDYRLEVSTDLLMNSKMTVSQVAKECGFENSNYFFTLFKKKYKRTPTEFKKEGDKNINEPAIRNNETH